MCLQCWIGEAVSIGEAFIYAEMAELKECKDDFELPVKVTVARRPGEDLTRHDFSNLDNCMLYYDKFVLSEVQQTKKIFAWDPIPKNFKNSQHIDITAYLNSKRIFWSDF